MPGVEARLKIIIGGTFDPIHKGHLKLAREIARLAPETNICLMPAAEPVHRDEPKATPQQRIEMIRLAIAGEDSIKVDDREIRRQGPSYTIESLQQMKQDDPSGRFVWVVGKDAYLQLHSWHLAEQLCQFCHLLVVERPGIEAVVNESKTIAQKIGFRKASSFEQLRAQPAGLEFHIPTPMLDISSTKIRDLLLHNQSTAGLLADEVRTYIDINKLYG